MMDSDGARFAAITETTSFPSIFPDQRQAGVLLLILLAVIAGAEAFTNIARLHATFCTIALCDKFSTR